MKFRFLLTFLGLMLMLGTGLKASVADLSKNALTEKVRDRSGPCKDNQKYFGVSTENFSLAEKMEFKVMLVPEILTKIKIATPKPETIRKFRKHSAKLQKKAVVTTYRKPRDGVRC